MTANQLAPARASSLPALIAAAGERAGIRFLEFFAANIPNAHTRRAYMRAAGDFLAWCEAQGVASISDIQPLHAATFIEMQSREWAAPAVKQSPATIRPLSDWPVTGQVVPVNPASPVRGPSHSVKHGKTPVLAPDEARTRAHPVRGNAPHRPKFYQHISIETSQVSDTI